MSKNTHEKSLVQVNENSIFYIIKRFFKNLFNRNTITTEYGAIVEKTNKLQNDEKKISFLEELRNYENEETKLLSLQKLYRSGKIKEEELSGEQIIELCKLYDTQIARLKSSNTRRKQKLLEYRRKTQNA